MGSLGGGAPGAGKSSQNKCLEKTNFSNCHLHFPRNAARPERQQHPLLPSPQRRKDGGCACRCEGENGLGSSCFTLQSFGDILHSPLGPHRTFA